MRKWAMRRRPRLNSWFELVAESRRVRVVPVLCRNLWAFLRTSAGTRLHTERLGTAARTTGHSADLQVEQLAEVLLP